MSKMWEYRTQGTQDHTRYSQHEAVLHVHKMWLSVYHERTFCSNRRENRSEGKTMSISAFLDAVNAIVERNIAADTPENIPSELDNLISRSGVIRDFASGLISSADSFVTDNTTQPEQAVFDTIAKQGEADFAKTVRGVMKDVSQDVLRLLKQDASIQDISGRLQLRYGRLRHVADTIALTSRTALSRANRINKAEKAGVKRLRYFGAPAERDFCVEHLNNIYTIEQIRQMDNGQGLEVLYYCGGFRCRHSWLPVVE